MNFDHKVAVVTGGASGIGRAAAEILAARGAAVAILDVKGGEGQSVADGVAARGGRAIFCPADVAQAAEVNSAVGQAREAFGPIDALIASAGIQRYGNALTTPDEQWAEVMSVNLNGAWYAARACLPDLRRRGGAIVNVASVQSLASQTNVLAYTVSKHAMIGLTRSMAIDFAPDNVRVNAVCPGTVDTPMLRWSASLDPNPQSVIEACENMHPLGRIARPEEIAEVIAFLAHESASFVTSAVWTVDGGLLARIGGAPRTGREKHSS
jgi:NAD(P)-dependent dehydrogenase (short-subunit alcohol dehydrogenase family)